MPVRIASVGIGIACARPRWRMEGTVPAAFINIPAMIIVFAGTAGATMAAVGMEKMKLIPEALQEGLHLRAARPRRPRRRARVASPSAPARTACSRSRSEVEAIDDAFTRKGMQLVVDGTDPDLLREILEAEIDAMHARHKRGAEVFEKAGGFAPTIGVLGTVMGLVHVLENLSQPEILGPAISGAFIATLLGVGTANVVFLPVANRLQALSARRRWRSARSCSRASSRSRPATTRASSPRSS